MRLGIQFSQPAVRPSPVNAIDAYLRLIERAHRAGFASFWAGQHFLSGDYQLFQPLPLLARASAAVPGMTLGTSVLLLPMLNPLDVAEQGAAVDAMTGGRFVLGVGLGYRDPELAASGIRREEMVGRFEEGVRIVGRLWEGREDPIAGRFYRLAEGRINPRPVQQPRPPILGGAYAEPAVVRAARLTDGWIVPPELHGAALERRLELFREAREGRPATLAVMRPFHPTRDADEAATIHALLSQHFGRKRTWGLQKGADAAASDAAADASASAIVGDPERCVEAIAACHERWRPDHLILLMGFRGTDEGALERAIELAGERVLPRVNAPGAKRSSGNVAAS
jgi:alkanesulfonate monooxygenase SsuD/methylene tetrahydromethanopterin reductase-like flavin-dependent oxidoreductase (luciferase family)